MGGWGTNVSGQLKVCLFNKLTSVFLCVCPGIDHEFRHHISKVPVDPRNCRIAGSRSLTLRINFKFMCLSAY